uniref:C2H2-type domain-containing protein n=1 Tax=Strigamia maritima TaxID=126957 RepID=T1IWF7_STRMM
MGLENNTWTNCNGPMTFRKRNERIDWRKIASIDLERISRELDFDTLQDNIANVAFCNIECELDPRNCDPNYTKLFRLAQLIIEYLLHSQDYLSHTVVALEEKCRFLTSQFECEKKHRAGTEELIKSLKCDVKKYKKLNSSQKNPTLQQTMAECHACPFCPKIFLTSEYLQMHMKRRHLETCQPETQNQVAELVDKLEKEVSDLKEQLYLTQLQLQDHHKTKTSDDMQEWKVQQLESQKKEIESIRDLFMKEMREINDRTTFAEYCVNNLQKELHDVCKSPPPSPATQIPITVPPIKEENCDFLKGQKKEFCKLRKGLTQHVEDVVCHQLKAHEDSLQKRIKCLAKEQTQELEKLNTFVQEKFCKPDLLNTETMLHDLCERTKEQERKLKKQQRKIEELLCTQTLTPAACAEPKAEPKPCPKMRKDSDINSNESLQSPYRTKHVEALKNNKSLVDGLREEFSSMLQDKLNTMGIASKQQITSPAHSKRVSIHPRSKSWSGGHNTDVDEDDDDDESDESEIAETIKSRKRSLPKSPSMPIQTVNLKESDGEWKRKITKPSRLLSTKESFNKLVTSVKKKFKPGKFWRSHSTPIKEKKQKEAAAIQSALQSALQTAQLVRNESTSSAVELQYEHEDSEEEDDEDESEDEIEREERKDEFKTELKMPHRANLENIEKFAESKNDSTSEWASSSSELEEVIPQKSPQTTARLFTILPQKANKSLVTPISDAAKKLEEKLTGTRTKPFGGVDTIGLKNKTVSNSLEDFDSSSESEKEAKTKNKNTNIRQPVPLTNKTSAWNNSAKKDAVKSGEKKAPVKSMYDWDSDEDISEIT